MRPIDDQYAADAPTSSLLAAPLAVHLPRRWRCGSCAAFESDADGTDAGLLIPPSGGCAANDRCTSWRPRTIEWYNE